MSAEVKQDPPLHYVYILRSESDPDRFYVGLTTDLERRLSEHNSGKSIHTNKHMPWKLLTYIAFSGRKKAERFEGYLKSGSGRSFAKKHF
jgi:predicted GIY-YIG superfamily endonuclease